MSSDQQILEDLAQVMRKALPDQDLAGPYDSDTRILADMGLASIDVIIIAEKIEEHYGRKFPFGNFLAGLRQKGADDLTLGEIVEFLRPLVLGENR
jgi:acyl carrier protein